MSLRLRSCLFVAALLLIGGLSLLALHLPAAAAAPLAPAIPVGIDLLRGTQVIAAPTPLSGTIPPPPPDPLGDIQAIAAGSDHTCALTAGGGVLCWGDNTYGQLGDGTRTARSWPEGVAGLPGGVQMIAAGQRHTCALTIDGGVKCWGDNGAGQLGNGTYDAQTTPVDVVGLTSGVQAIAATWFNTCALTVDGGVKCWGDNHKGELGNDSLEWWSNVPVDVVGLASGVGAVASGGSHTCALLASGALQCWGDNTEGQLGDGTTTERRTPVDVVGLSGGVQAVAANNGFTCALASGGVWCWGDNDQGQLGNGTNTDSPAPVAVVGLESGAQAVAAGESFACAVTAGGGLQCWGLNDRGQLGDGTTTGRRTPAPVAGLDSGVQAVALGWAHACALLTTGGVQCWGGNYDGELGDGTSYADANRSAPADVLGLNGPVTAISAGGHTCAIVSDRLWCWGANGDGQLGDGTTIHRSTPVAVLGLEDGVQAVAVGAGYTCAITSSGGLMCWGTNWQRQLGDGTITGWWTPAPVAGLESGVQAIATGLWHVCALTTGGAVYCWGANNYGQLGDGTTTDRGTPAPVIGLDAGVQAISAGNFHTCALLADGSVQCWGQNAHGELGNGATADSATPAMVLGLRDSVQGVAAGGSIVAAHTCALLVNGGVQCWGGNIYGNLGDGTNTSSLTPVDVLGLDSGVQAISAGGSGMSSHTCALTDAGSVKCWGDNYFGQLGNGATTGSWSPVDVLGLRSSVTAISTGARHTCALTAEGARCWGSNGGGELGNGASGAEADKRTPVDVIAGQPGLRARSDVAAVTAGGSGLINVLANDRPGANPNLILAAMTQPGAGSAAVIVNNQVQFTAGAFSPGASVASFTYTVIDRDGLVSAAPVTVQIVPPTSLYLPDVRR